MLIGFTLIAVDRRCGAWPSDWRHEQHFTVTAPGLIKLNLPRDTLNGARPTLEDLRLYDDSGKELPYAIERPAPLASPLERAQSFHVSLENNSTVMTLETGVTRPIDNVALETPAPDFIKSVNMEGSTDGQHWHVLAQHQPIFRSLSGTELLRVSFSSGVWPWLRLTVDDQRSSPIPFLGTHIHATSVEQPPVESQPAQIVERDENPGETRLTVDLGAANLDLASLAIETDEPLFTRAITLLEPQVTEALIGEKPIGQGLIYRIALNDQATSANLSVPLATSVTSRELIVLIRNEDSSPLRISAIRVERRPLYLTFMARQTGVFHLLTGNKFCAGPRYDLAELGTRFKAVPIAGIVVSPVAGNPDFREPEALRGLEIAGAPLDVSDWEFRKPIHLTNSGAEQIELDLDVCAHSALNFSDVRILSGTNQVPYLIEHTSITRSVALTATTTNDVKNRNLSRWVIQLPRADLPFSRLTCESKDPLFQREMSLYEELADDRGNIYRSTLGDAVWTQTPQHGSKVFVLTLNETPRADTLYLQTDNGNNPPIELGNFAASYTATRVLFKANVSDQLFLYYGNPRAGAANYDLSLVAGDLLAADKSTATLDSAQPLKRTSTVGSHAQASGGVLFWIALAAVVIGLLAIVARLLPKTQ